MRSDHPSDSKRLHKIKKASKKKTRPETIHPHEISADNSKGENHGKSDLIYFGGNYMGRPDYSESKRTPMKTFKQLREEMAETLISLRERKSKRKSKSQRAGADPLDDRKKKIQDLKKNDSLWQGLE